MENVWGVYTIGGNLLSLHRTLVGAKTHVERNLAHDTLEWKSSFMDGDVVSVAARRWNINRLDVRP